MAGFASDFGARLSKLTFNSKDIINDLTHLADEGKQAHRKDVVALILGRLRTVSAAGGVCRSGLWAFFCFSLPI